MGPVTYLGPALGPDGARPFGPEEPAYPSDPWQRIHMRRLEQRIRAWKVAYYLGEPEVDDQTFDLHWHNLLHLEARYPHLADPASPTQGVGYDTPERNPR